MQRCEVHELAISSLIDGELNAPQTLTTFEHVLTCQSCAAFFRRARRLEDQLAPLRDDRAPVATAAPRLRPWAVARWSAAVIAMLLVGLALGRLDGDLGPAAPAPSTMEVGDGGKMSDDRFVAVATELLQADSRDRIEMLQVLQHVQKWNTEESPGRTAALRTDVDLSPRWSQLPLTGETAPIRDVY